jgi:hypothetical protein
MVLRKMCGLLSNASEFRMDDRSPLPMAMAQSLGRVEGQLEAVASAIATLTASVDGSRTAGDVQRKEFTTALNFLESEVKALRDELNEVKPVTEQLQRWQAVGFGAVLVLGFLFSTAGALLVYFKEQVHRLLTGG